MTASDGDGRDGDALGAEGGDGLNRSLDDLIDLLADELARLKEALEFWRLSDSEHRSERIRWHVQAIDEREDALEQALALRKAAPDAGNDH